MNRYQRQSMVAQIGECGQQKLGTAHVVIVGMGGLGAPASLYLAGAGVGRLTLIDHDTVSLTNLHRQVLYRESDAGHHKAKVAQKTLTDLNREIDIVACAEKLNADNIAQRLSDADVVVDATDNFAVSYLLSDYALLNQVPLVCASVIKVNGYVGVFCHATQSDAKLNQKCPSLRAVFPNPPAVGQDCNQVGVVGTAAGVMGVLQAQEVIKVILGDANQLAGRLLSVDLWTYRQHIVDFSLALEPQNKVEILSKKGLFCPENKNSWIVDVRSRAEAKKAPKACHQQLPLSEFDVAKLALDKRLVFVCASGQRALFAADSAMRAGCRNAAVLLS